MIQGDPTTRAVDSLRGYAYQIWQTLFAWLRLGPSEDLFLEVVEDFAVANDAQLVAVQVKDSKKTLTLGSRHALKALGAFLKLRDQNPGRQVLFRFLTTAIPGREEGAPFGTDRKGIDEWERCQTSRDLSLASMIATVLGTSQHLPDSLAQFLRNASPAMVLETLVLAVSWETGIPRMPGVEAAVNELLITLGEPLGVPPSESVKVVGTLLKEVLSRATQPDPLSRKLARARLLELFEEATTERVPASELRALRRVAGSLSEGFWEILTAAPDVTQIMDPDAASRVLSHPPRPLTATVSRPTLLDRGRAALSKMGVLFLTGSIGVGKTLLAADLADALGRAVAWVPSRHRLFSVRQLLNVVDAQRSNCLWVLDALDLTAPSLEASLVTLFYAIKERGDWLVVTTRTRPTARWRRDLGVDEGAVLDVGPLDEAEVSALCRVLGCPESINQEWTQAAVFHTSGHAQLAHALLLDLHSKAWPLPAPSHARQTPAAVTRERREMQEVLMRALPDNAAVFVCYLSSYPGLFRREQALAIGSIRGLAGPLPGRILDSLSGPYLEEVGDGYYRLSPLLSDVAKHTWSREDVRRAQGDVARAVLSNSTRLTLIDVDALLVAGILASLDDVITSVCSGVLREWPVGKDGLAQHLSWLVGIDLEAKITSPRARYLFHWLEFRIGGSTNPRACLPILEAWDRAAHDLPNTDEALLASLGVAVHAIVTMSAPLPVRLVLEYLVAIADLCEASPAAAQKWSNWPPQSGPIMSLQSFWGCNS